MLIIVVEVDMKVIALSSLLVEATSSWSKFVMHIAGLVLLFNGIYTTNIFIIKLCYCGFQVGGGFKSTKH